MSPTDRALGGTVRDQSECNRHNRLYLAGCDQLRRRRRRRDSSPRRRSVTTDTDTVRGRTRDCKQSAPASITTRRPQVYLHKTRHFAPTLRFSTDLHSRAGRPLTRLLPISTLRFVSNFRRSVNVLVRGGGRGGSNTHGRLSLSHTDCALAHQAGVLLHVCVDCVAWPLDDRSFESACLYWSV